MGAPRAVSWNLSPMSPGAQTPSTPGARGTPGMTEEKDRFIDAGHKTSTNSWSEETDRLGGTQETTDTAHDMCSERPRGTVREFSWRASSDSAPRQRAVAFALLDLGVTVLVLGLLTCLSVTRSPLGHLDLALEPAQRQQHRTSAQVLTSAGEGGSGGLGLARALNVLVRLQQLQQKAVLGEALSGGGVAGDGGSNTRAWPGRLRGAGARGEGGVGAKTGSSGGGLSASLAAGEGSYDAAAAGDRAMGALCARVGGLPVVLERHSAPVQGVTVHGTGARVCMVGEQCAFTVHATPPATWQPLDAAAHLPWKPRVSMRGPATVPVHLLLCPESLGAAQEARQAETPPTPSSQSPEERGTPPSKLQDPAPMGEQGHVAPTWQPHVWVVSYRAWQPGEYRVSLALPWEARGGQPAGGPGRSFPEGTVDKVRMEDEDLMVTSLTLSPGLQAAGAGRGLKTPGGDHGLRVPGDTAGGLRGDSSRVPGGVPDGDSAPRPGVEEEATARKDAAADRHGAAAATSAWEGRGLHVLSGSSLEAGEGGGAAGERQGKRKGGEEGAGTASQSVLSWALRVEDGAH